MRTAPGRRHDGDAKGRPRGAVPRPRRQRTEAQPHRRAIAVPELAGMSGWFVAHALTGRELDEDIWPQPRVLVRLIDYPQPDRDIYRSASPVGARMVESATVAYARCGELQDPDGEGVTR